MTYEFSKKELVREIRNCIEHIVLFGHTSDDYAILDNGHELYYCTLSSIHQDEVDSIVYRIDAEGINSYIDQCSEEELEQTERTARFLTDLYIENDDSNDIMGDLQ
jgi:hypothetical protein